jgi:DNA uptake protein ComE-like DNA-binding protein
MATGHIPPPTVLGAKEAVRQAAPREADHEAEVERELAALKRAMEAGRVDVNRATVSDWRQLPGCTAEQADLLVRLQAGGVQLSGPDDLRRLLRLDAATLAAWLPRLVFHWYGEPAPLAPVPVAINRAGAAELRERLGLGSERLNRLQLERLRAPFLDLADLQQRLQLPATVVEAWIGRVSFEGPEAPSSALVEPAAKPGPSLPPTRRRSVSHPGPTRRP